MSDGQVGGDPSDDPATAASDDRLTGEPAVVREHARISPGTDKIVHSSSLNDAGRLLQRRARSVRAPQASRCAHRIGEGPRAVSLACGSTR